MSRSFGVSRPIHVASTLLALPSSPVARTETDGHMDPLHPVTFRNHTRPRRIQAATDGFRRSFRRKKSNQFKLFEALFQAWSEDPSRVLAYDTLLAALGYEPIDTLPQPILEAKARLARRLESFEARGIRFGIENVRAQGYRLVVFDNGRVAWKGGRLHAYDRKAWPGGVLKVGAPVPSRAWILAIPAAALLFATVWHVAGSGARTVPAHLHLEEGSLVWMDEEGRTLRRQTLREIAGGAGAVTDVLYEPCEGGRSYRLADLEGDGVPETIVALQEIVSGTGRVYLHCLDSDGSPRWKVRAGRSLTNRGGSAPASDFTRVRLEAWDLDGDGTREVVARFEHRRFSPTQILVLDARGSLLTEYWHDGHVYTITPMPAACGEGPGLLLGGVNDPRGRAFLTVLPIAGMRGTNREAEFEVPGLRDCREPAYLLFPRTPLAEARREKPQVSRVDFAADGTIDVEVADAGLGEGAAAQLYFTLEPDLEPVRVLVGDGARAAHRLGWAIGALPGGEETEGWSAVRSALQSVEVHRHGARRQILIPVTGLPDGRSGSAGSAVASAGAAGTSP